MRLHIFLLALTSTLHAKDWPMWGGTPSRNMVAEAKGIPTEIVPGEIDPEKETVDLAGAKNILWTAKLGSQTYGNPVVANGKILRDGKFKRVWIQPASPLTRAWRFFSPRPTRSPVKTCWSCRPTAGRWCCNCCWRAA